MSQELAYLANDVDFAILEGMVSSSFHIIYAFCLVRQVACSHIWFESSIVNDPIQVFQQDTQGALQLFKGRKEARILEVTQQNFGIMAKSGAETDEAGLVTKLLQEMKEWQRVECGVHDWNNVIHFFCKKRLMQDAEKALKNMRSLGQSPKAQTFW